MTELAKQISEARAALLVQREILSMILTELALLHPEPAAKMEEMLAEEEGKSFAAISAQENLDSQFLRELLVDMDKAREDLFVLARARLKVALTSQ